MPRKKARKEVKRWTWVNAKEDQYQVVEILGADGRLYWETTKNYHLPAKVERTRDGKVRVIDNPKRAVYVQTLKRFGAAKVVVCNCRGWAFSESHGKAPSHCPHTEPIRLRLKRLSNDRRAKARANELRRVHDAGVVDIG